MCKRGVGIELRSKREGRRKMLFREFLETNQFNNELIESNL